MIIIFPSSLCAGLDSIYARFERSLKSLQLLNVTYFRRVPRRKIRNYKRSGRIQLRREGRLIFPYMHPGVPDSTVEDSTADDSNIFLFL